MKNALGYKKHTPMMYWKAVELRTTTLNVDPKTGLECKYFPKKTLEPDQVPRRGEKRGSGLWLRW